MTLILTVDVGKSFSRCLHFPFRFIVQICTWRTPRNIYHWSKVKKTTFLKCMVSGIRCVFGLSVHFFYGPSRKSEIPAVRVILEYLASGISNSKVGGPIKT